MFSKWLASSFLNFLILALVGLAALAARVAAAYCAFFGLGRLPVLDVWAEAELEAAESLRALVARAESFLFSN